MLIYPLEFKLWFHFLDILYFVKVDNFMKMGNDWTLCLSYILYAVSMTKEKPAFPENDNFNLELSTPTSIYWLFSNNKYWK